MVLPKFSKKNKTIVQSWIKWGVIPLLLVGLWLFLTILYMVIYDNSFLVLSYPHKEASFQQKTYDRLEKGEKLIGSFVAQENNLGIVGIRFNKFLRIPYKDEDTLVFRLKEKGAKKWYSQNSYKSGLTFDVPFLPFGFPVIADSKGKEYIFELESLAGNKKNGVVLSRREPNLVSKYQVQKSFLLADKKELVFFLTQKLYTSLQTIDILFSSFVYLLPLVLYYIFILPFFAPLRKQFGLPILKVLGRIGLKKLTITYPIIFLLGIILLDTFFLQIDNDALYIVCISLWLILLKLQKQESKYSFVIGIIFLLFTPLFFFFDKVSVALQANSWAFIFFVAGIIQLVVGFKRAR